MGNKYEHIQEEQTKKAYEAEKKAREKKKLEEEQIKKDRLDAEARDKKYKY